MCPLTPAPFDLGAAGGPPPAAVPTRDVQDPDPAQVILEILIAGSCRRPSDNE